MNPVSCYTSIDFGYPYGIRGTKQQTNTGLLWRPPAAPKFGASAPNEGVLSGLALGFFDIQNRAGGTYTLGIGVRIPNRLWQFGTWQDSDTSYTLDANAQGTATAVALNNTTNNNDGHLILSRVPFNCVSYNITQAVTGSPVNAIRYTNGGTSATVANNYTTVVNPYALPASSAGTYPGTGEMAIAFALPTDFAKTASSTSNGTGVPAGHYGMLFRSTTKPTQAAQATGIEIFRLYFVTENVGDNLSIVQDFGAKDFLMAMDPNGGSEGYYGDALVAAFLDPASASQGVVANMGNRVVAQVRGI